MHERHTLFSVQFLVEIVFVSANITTNAVDEHK